MITDISKKETGFYNLMKFMKKNKVNTVVAVLTAGFMLTGCGTPLYELTEEEVNLIAYSAARMVSKYNIQQKDGMINVVIEEEETEEKKQDKKPVATENSKKEEDKTNTQSTSSNKAEMVEKVSFASAIGHGSDLSITYKGSSISKNYTEGSYYSLDAENGKTFYIMKFGVTNTSNSIVKLDNVSLNATFKLIAEDLKVNAEVTFLDTDLATYLGEIAPGATADTILLFEIPEEKARELSKPELQVIINKEVKVVDL